MAFLLQTGKWGVARRILAGGGPRVHRAIHQAVLQEAHYLRKKVVEGLREQAPGGKAFKPLAPLTLALRKLRGFGGTKALMVRGDMRNSITVKPVGVGAAFVGILRTARGKDGQVLANIAEVNEYGSKPIVIRITPKMRALLAAVAAQGGGGSSSGTKPSGPGKGFMVVQIPPRPFFRPVLEKDFKPHEVRMRFLARVGRNLNGDFGQIGIPIPNGGGGSGGPGGGPGGGGGGKPPRVKDPKRVAAAKLGWARRRAGGK